MREDREEGIGYDRSLIKPQFLVILLVLGTMIIVSEGMKHPGVLFVGTKQDLNHIKNSEWVKAGNINKAYYMSNQADHKDLQSFLSKVSNLTILLLIPESSFREARGDKIDKAIAKLKIIKGYELFSRNIAIMVTKTSGQIIYLDCLRRYLNYTVDVELQDPSKIRRTNRLLVSSIVQRGAVMTEIGSNNLYGDAIKEIEEFKQIQSQSVKVIEQWKSEILSMIFVDNRDYGEKGEGGQDWYLAHLYHFAKYKKSKNLFGLLPMTQMNKARLLFWKLSEDSTEEQKFYQQILEKSLKIGVANRCKSCIEPNTKLSNNMLETKCKDKLREDMNICNHDDSYDETACMFEEYMEAMLSLRWGQVIGNAKMNNSKKEL